MFVMCAPVRFATAARCTHMCSLYRGTHMCSATASGVECSLHTGACAGVHTGVRTGVPLEVV